MRIPVGTVLWEEIAFRGVLQAALRRVMPGPAAIAVTSGVFGIWHVRPTAGALRINGLAGDRGQAMAARRRGRRRDHRGRCAVLVAAGASGRLAAPVLLHLATNCGGLVTAWASHRIEPRDAPVSRA